MTHWSLKTRSHASKFTLHIDFIFLFTLSYFSGLNLYSKWVSIFMVSLIFHYFKYLLYDQYMYI